MQLARYQKNASESGVGLIDGGALRPLSLDGKYTTLAHILDADDPAHVAQSRIIRAAPLPLESIALLPPIDHQEVWAAGVTYRRSRTARMEESQGAARFYDMVYEAARPELFFKATPHRVVGPGSPVRIRRDAKWNVPEPELALVINARKQLVGYTIGNDMSSRDIEGENPLYLPQAKVYDGCCGLGPWVTLASAMPAPETIGIKLAIHRGDNVVFQGETSVGNLNRTLSDLVGWLVKECSFPDGAFLLTGTGIVPTDEFTLHVGDVVDITIDGIGTLSNPVAS